MSVLQEVIAYLVAQNVIGSAAIFGSSSASIPTSLDSSLVVTETPGLTPLRDQNTAGVVAQRPHLQIVARGVDYQTARALAKRAYDALAAIRGTTLGSTRYLDAIPNQEPFDLPPDTQGRTRSAFNVRILKEPS